MDNQTINQPSKQGVNPVGALPGCQVYELEDPRESGFPRWVGYGFGLTPWTSLWEFRQSGVGPLFDWLRELDTAGLQPSVSTDFGLGRNPGCQIDAPAARMFAEERIKQVCRMAVGDPPDGPLYPSHPTFLLNPRIGRPDDRKPIVAEPVDAANATNTTVNTIRFEFASVGHAVEHGFTRSAVYNSLATGCPYKGLVWRYAAGVKPGPNSVAPSNESTRRATSRSSRASIKPPERSECRVKPSPAPSKPPAPIPTANAGETPRVSRK